MLCKYPTMFGWNKEEVILYMNIYLVECKEIVTNLMDKYFYYATTHDQFKFYIKFVQYTYNNMYPR